MTRPAETCTQPAQAATQSAQTATPPAATTTRPAPALGAMLAAALCTTALLLAPAPAGAQLATPATSAPPATPAPSPQQADLQRRLQINALAAAGRYAQALALAEPILQQAQRDAAAGTPGARLALLNALGGSAQLYLSAGNDEQALDLYSQALALSAVPDSGLMLQGLPALVPAFDHVATRLGRQALIVQRFEPLLAGAGLAAPALWPLRLDIRARLGRAALGAGDPALAERQLTAALQERVASIGVLLQTPIMLAPGKQVQGDLTTLRNVQQRLRETVGAMGQNHQASRSDGRPARDYAVRHGWPDADTPAANLVRLYGMPGRSAQLVRFYRGDFADYARAMLRVPQEEGYVELEMEYALCGAYLAAAGRWQLAHQAIGEALRLNALRLPAQLTYLTPDYAGAAFATRRDLVDLLLSSHLAAATAPAAWADAAGELLQIKSLGGRQQAQRTAALRHAHQRADHREVASLQAAINTLDPNASVQAYYQQWSLDTRLQAMLAPAMAPLQMVTGEQLLAQVRQALGAETLLSFSLFQPFDLATLERLPARYLGQRLTADGGAIVDLGPAAAIDAGLGAWRRELLAPPADGAAPAGSAAMYRRLLQPLLGTRAADGAYAVLADAALLQFPFEALVDGDGQYLLARGPWRYPGSAWQMLEPAAPPATSATAVVFGAPDFDAPLPAPAVEGAAATPGASVPQRDAAPLPAAATLRPALQQLHFSPLPGTAAEADAVAALLRGAGQQVTLYTGAAATAAQLQTLRAPRYLHLATHGFFLGDAAGGSEEVTGRDGERYLHEMNVPQFNSGLALAGANRVAASVGSPGLLFSYQLRQLDLAGTDLVVLSACESGAGRLVAGVTVDSLRQALEAAGARSAVTTLWPVSDTASAELMQHFYRHLAAGTDKGEALRQAKLALAPRWRHPYYWAPYILSGAR